MQRYAQRSATIRAVLEDEQDTLMADAEAGSANMVRHPQAPGHTAARIYVTKTQGKHWGWIASPPVNVSWPPAFHRRPPGTRVIDLVQRARARTLAQREQALSAQHALPSHPLLDVAPTRAAEGDTTG
jgi:hypothetical protein